MTNWPEASAVAWATVLPASRSSTFSFGAARPAMTASPEGSTFTTSNAGSGGELAVGAAWLGQTTGCARPVLDDDRRGIALQLVGKQACDKIYISASRRADQHARDPVAGLREAIRHHARSARGETSGRSS